MILRKLKYKLKSKEFKILFISSLFAYILMYICIKNEFFYNATQYNLTYINYYIDKYLVGNLNDLIFDNNILMYIESDLQNIFSSLYIYVVSFNTNIFLFFTIIISLVIFHIISSNFHCDIFNNFSIPQISRIGRKKYIKNTIIINSIYFGLVMFLPRLIYLIFLLIFFPNGISATHFIDTASFITDKFLYVGYEYSPIIMITFDLIMVFMYGVILSLVSMTIVSCIKNKSLSYLIYLFTFATLSYIPLEFNQVSLMNYSSIYQYFNSFYIPSYELKVIEPIILISILLIISYIITILVLNKKVGKSI